MAEEGNEKRTRGPTYAIGELAKLGGVSRRTVRYYVQRGLLEAPTGRGRGRHYTQRHLDTLIRIRKLQEAGRPLAEIGSRVARGREVAPSPVAGEGRGEGPEPPSRPRLPRPSRFTTWTRITIADGVELHLRDVRLDSRQVREVGEAISGILPKETFDER